MARHADLRVSCGLFGTWWRAAMPHATGTTEQLQKGSREAVIAVLYKPWGFFAHTFQVLV